MFTGCPRFAVKFFKHFKDVLPCLLASITYVKKSPVRLSVAPLSVMYPFTMAAFKMFSLFLIFRSLTRICLGVISFVFVLLLAVCSTS